jgi:addiction module RelE/StbE family toxin
VFTIVTTRYFFRRSHKFLKKHPKLRERYERVIDDLKENPFALHLHYHTLSGEMEGLQAISLTYDYRIVLTVAVTAQEVILLDIGSHDEVYHP